MSIKVINPGALTTIQDRGRFSLLDKGFSPSGAADLDALMTANALVGNSPYEACLEMTLTGVTLRFEEDCLIAITGGDMQGRLDGERIPMNAPIIARKNSYLNLTFPSSGSVRTYLAIGGGLDIPEVFGSRSTSMKFSLGGLGGRALRSGDVIGLRDPKTAVEKYEGLRERRKAKQLRATLTKWFRKYYKMPSSGDVNTLYSIVGPQDDMFTREGQATLFSEEYIISPDSDRMGIRLCGKEIEAKNGYDIISDGIVHGSIQVSKNGLPIILSVDRQTTGGYAKIATVSSFSLPMLGRLYPGMRVAFRRIKPKRAAKMYRKKMAAYEKFYRKINRKTRGELI